MVDIMSNIIIYIIISTNVAYVVGLSVNPFCKLCIDIE